MKKILVFILAVFYLSASISASVNAHYCADNIRSWVAQPDLSGNCADCGTVCLNKDRHYESQKKDCCEGRQKTVNDQKLTRFVYPGFKYISRPAVPSQGVSRASSSPELNSFTYDPPLPQKVPVFIRHCVFRI